MFAQFHRKYSEIYVPKRPFCDSNGVETYGRDKLDDILVKKSQKVFEILVRENTRMLMVYLRSLVRDESVIEDLFQESMIIAWRRLDDCDLDRPFGPWLRGIASRLVKAHYRKRKLAPIVLHDAVLFAVDRQFEHINLQVGDTWDEKVFALHQCIDELPKKQKGVLIGKYFDSLQTQLLADQFELTYEACKKRLQRGRAVLAECLKRKGVMSTAEAKS